MDSSREMRHMYLLYMNLYSDRYEGINGFYSTDAALNFLLENEFHDGFDWYPENPYEFEELMQDLEIKMNFSLMFEDEYQGTYCKSKKASSDDDLFILYMGMYSDRYPDSLCFLSRESTVKFLKEESILDKGVKVPGSNDELISLLAENDVVLECGTLS